ncbi:MAG TPA: hypothetical protein VM390_07945, partial [Acidimicrobiales bacterium]|nr:hypothetical protein [Acidimicrobiales bacterium]
MRAPAPPRAVVPVLAAAAGVVVAHAGGYVAAFPAGARRDPHLEATGHGYWPVAVAVAVVAAGVALVLAATAGAARGASARPPNPHRRVARRLAGWQVGAFVLLEVGERAVAGVPATELLASRAFWLGLALQLPVAVLAARLLLGAERAGARAASALRRRRWRPAAGDRRGRPLP